MFDTSHYSVSSITGDEMLSKRTSRKTNTRGPLKYCPWSRRPLSRDSSFGYDKESAQRGKPVRLIPDSEI